LSHRQANKVASKEMVLAIQGLATTIIVFGANDKNLVET
jgi:hypothetical protein